MKRKIISGLVIAANVSFVVILATMITHGASFQALFTSGTWMVTALLVLVAIHFIPTMARTAWWALASAVSVILITAALFWALAWTLGSIRGGAAAASYLLALTIAVGLAAARPVPHSWKRWRIFTGTIIASLLHIVILRGLASMQYLDQASLIDDKPSVMVFIPALWIVTGSVISLAVCRALAE